MRPDGVRAIPALRLVRAARNLLEAADHPEISTASRAAHYDRALESVAIAVDQIDAAVAVLESVVDEVGPSVGESLVMALELLTPSWEDGERWGS